MVALPSQKVKQNLETKAGGMISGYWGVLISQAFH